MNKYFLPRGAAYGRAVLHATALVLIALISMASAAIRGLYVGGDFYPPSAAAEATAKYSGFNRLFLFTAHVRANGDVYYNDTLIATNGSYVGNSTWGSRLAAVKNDGHINRIELCIGSWGSPAFDNIRDLVASQGTGSTSILYRNFLAIKNALGIEAIQYDDELTYHTASAVSFGQMLIGMGLKVTLCPYNWNVRTFWQNVKSQLGANCDAIYLQCYDGGAGNNPADWNTLFNFKVTPGLWGNTISSAAAISQFRTWQNSLGCQGGFMWLNGSLQWDTLLWGDCLRVALEPLPFMMFVNQGSGKCLDLIGGDTADAARVNQWTYDYGGGNQRWALLPTENNDHFKIISYVSGRAACVSQDSTADGAQIHQYWYTGNNPAQQWDLVDAGNGWFKVRNVKSGKLLDVDGSNLNANDARVQQWGDLNGMNQKWRLQPQGDYYVRAASGRYVCVQGMGSTNGSPIIQYDGQNNPWFKWRFESVGDGNYKLSSLNALGRVLCVVGGSTASAANTHLWDYNVNNAGDQKVRIKPLPNGKQKFYFAHTGMSWDIPGGNTANNTPLQQYPDNGFGWQQFSLERLP